MADDADERAVGREGVGDGDAGLGVALVVAGEPRERDAGGLGVARSFACLSGELDTALDALALADRTRRSAERRCRSSRPCLAATPASPAGSPPLHPVSATRAERQRDERGHRPESSFQTPMTSSCSIRGVVQTRSARPAGRPQERSSAPRSACTEVCRLHNTSISGFRMPASVGDFRLQYIRDS